MPPKAKRQRAYSIVWNNYPEDWRKSMETLAEHKNTRFLLCGKEVGQQGTPHLQCHIDLKNATTIKALQKKIKKMGMQLAIKEYTSQAHTDNGRNYCYKDGDTQQWGEAPEQGARNDLEELQEAIRLNPNMTRRNLFEQHASVMARYPRFAAEYQNMVREYKTLTWDEPPNLWIWGEAGVGKTRQIHEDEHPLYLKNANKWFDYYQGEHTVLIDDIGPEQARYLGYHIKLWADRYPFLAEIKGSAIKIRPQRIVITSNYSISEMGWDEQTTAAISRRFKEIHME